MLEADWLVDPWRGNRSMKDARDLIARWSARRADFARLHALVDGSSLIDEILSDLEQLAARTDEEGLTLAQASKRCGYAPDSLSRLIRQEKLTNIGRRGAPRVRASELPKRPSNKLAEHGSRPYDPSTDARLLRIRR